MSLRLPPAASADDRHTAWVRVIERVYTEQVNQGWRHRTFRLLKAVFTTNQQLSDAGGFLFNWMAENYVDSALMVVRRELDVQAGTENLRNLLEDIIGNPTVLTRARYLAQWGPADAVRANRAFDSFVPARTPGLPSDDYIDPAVVNADLDKLVADVERLRVFAERTRAHRTPEQNIDNTVTFRDLHTAISDIREVVGKYYALLTLKVVRDWEPTPQYNTMEAFERPWVTDAAGVRRAMDE